MLEGERFNDHNIKSCGGVAPSGAQVVEWELDRGEGSGKGPQVPAAQLRCLGSSLCCHFLACLSGRVIFLSQGPDYPTFEKDQFREAYLRGHPPPSLLVTVCTFIQGRPWSSLSSLPQVLSRGYDASVLSPWPVTPLA